MQYFAFVLTYTTWWVDFAETGAVEVLNF